MVQKTLSTGTLNLRFMRSAHPVETRVDDDGEWEATSYRASTRSGSTVTYETSYLPFLFPSLHPRGRRVFNEHVTNETLSPDTKIDVPANDAAKRARTSGDGEETRKKMRSVVAEIESVDPGHGYVKSTSP